MTFRCYGPLNDFLPIERRQVSFSVPFAGERSVKDAIESIGVAHVEVDLILVNGDPSLFNALVSDGNRIAVFQWFRSIDISTMAHVRVHGPDSLRFVLEGHLGKLARRLRLVVGLDTNAASR